MPTMPLAMKLEDISRIAVIGAGLMGHGIAQEFAVAGYEVLLHDQSAEVLRHAVERIGNGLYLLVELGMIGHDQIAPARSRIRVTTSLEDAVANADLVIEAVFEDLGLKQRLFGDLDELCDPRTILASNTSTFLPSTLAAATRRPDKVLVTHYFNPPHLLPLVEIVRGAMTSDETVTTIVELLERIGKRPVLVRKEVPGFIGNRLLVALFREALAIVEQGIATPEDIDAVVTNGFGRRFGEAGPFALWELAGLDLIREVMVRLLPEIADGHEVSPLLTERVERGELGVKAGKGFYDWTPETAEALRRRIAAALVDTARWSAPP
jgi:3-hydroxybutyryl-CoA dehydrogenase